MLFSITDLPKAGYNHKVWLVVFLMTPHRLVGNLQLENGYVKIPLQRSVP